MLSFYEKLDLGAMSDFHGFQKKHPLDYLFQQKAEFGHAAFPGGTSLSRPCFARDHSNYCAVGAYWFLKGHLFDGDLLIFSFVCFSLCYVLNAMFIIYLLIKPQ